jgi:alkyl hydroperoxide reductase subunit AhpC
MNSDRDGKITKKSGLQKKSEENLKADERFVLEKRYKIRFVFPNSIAVL